MTEPPAARLAAAGFLAADDEAAQLISRAGGDAELLESLLERRLAGEPLAWVTGTTTFCGIELHVDRGVYVPRPHTELLAQTAAGHLPEEGTAVDLCTGCGAVARVLSDRRPQARVVGSDIDPRAVACARRNGVNAVVSDLAAALPRDLDGTVDVLTAVAPYVPTTELGLLQRDTFRFEEQLAYAGGADGLEVVRRVVQAGTELLRPGGVIVLEAGAGQAGTLASLITRMDYIDRRVLHDEDGDERGIAATLGAPGCKT